jgi:hypothetical protein
MEVIYLFVGFLASFICVKRSLMKSGAGNCKMCKSCDYYLDSKERERVVRESE